MADIAKEMGLAGTTAIIMVNFTHPIETIKTNLQVNKQFSIINFIKNEGPTALYKGIKPAWMREASYTSIKLGMYGPIKKIYGADKKDAPFLLKFAAGATAGSLGSVIGNPFDLLKTKQQAAKGKQTSTLDLAKNIFAKRGIAGFYNGVVVNATRACVLNGTKMACYDQIKGYVVDYTGWSRGDVRTAFTSAFSAGFFMACTVSPFDRVRSLLMNQPAGQEIYSGTLDCFAKTIKNEGITSLWRGFLPIWARFAPQATGQLLVFELLRNLAGMQTI